MKNNIILLRSIATVLVVLGHSVCIFCGYWGGVKVENEVFEFVGQYIYSFHMALFMSISGYCYGIKSYNINEYKCFIRRKTKRLLVPFVIFYFLWVIPWRAATKIYEGGYIGTLYKMISIPAFANLWFLLVLFLIFLLFLHSSSFMKHKVLFGILFAYLSIFSIKITGLNNLIHNYLYLIFFFWLGMIFREQESKVSVFLEKYYFCGLILHFYIVLRNAELFYSTGFMNFFTGLVGSACFWGIAWKYQKYSGNRVIKLINKNSMGIYLFHEPVMYCLALRLCENISNSILLWFSILICGIGISILGIEVVERMHFSWILGQ